MSTCTLASLYLINICHLLLFWLKFAKLMFAFAVNTTVTCVFSKATKCNFFIFTLNMHRGARNVSLLLFQISNKSFYASAQDKHVLSFLIPSEFYLDQLRYLNDSGFSITWQQQQESNLILKLTFYTLQLITWLHITIKKKKRSKLTLELTY